MSLAIFDLDNTLLGGDSDHAWGEFIVAHQIVDPEAYQAQNDRFFNDYLAGKLDIQVYLNFCLQLLGEHETAQLNAWHEAFMAEKITPIILPKALALIEKHSAAGDTLMIITATNRFITAPIARKLGIDILLATECERDDKGFTGRTTDVPCFREGKVTRLQRWLLENNRTLNGSYFYSDSHNDLPLLSMVEHPVAVDPDETLKAHAEAQGWPVVSLR
ncbi:HAD family hydrolase [Pseudomonas neustonica]|uniref:HAD family hydrolase n=1 Tax=Pseudomonas neustonica TaxID=2487346 RepID=A0ABX9XNR9_9PSED|nr:MULTISPECIES: HAD family hydrolase [Pseudomonas]ROZ85614.1 HAD family hydrolase [Pseudomonas sp. SSM44]ROZ87492.1 HAD family hydrolase [Pseudomonas neustonica]